MVMKKGTRIRIATVGVASTDHALDAQPGGSVIKTILFMILVHCKSSANAKLGLKVSHGPTASVFCAHSTPLATATFGATPCVIACEIDSTKAIGEFVLPILNIESADANDQWADVEVFEIRKPF